MGYTSGYGQRDINLDGGADGVSGVTRIRQGVEQEFPSITEALATAQAGDVVLVGPGDYAETLSVPDGVIVETLVVNAARILGASPNGPRVTLGAGASLRGFTVFSPMDSDAAIRMPNPDATMDSITLVGQSPTATGISASADRLFMTGTNILFAGVIGRGIEVTGGRFIVSEFVVGSAVVVDAAVAVDNGDLEVGPLRVVGSAAVVQDALQVNGGSVFSSEALLLSGLVANGLHITSDGVVVSMRSPFFDSQQVGVHLLVDPAVTSGSLFVVAGSGSRAKISASPAYLSQGTVEVSFQDDQPGDEAYVFQTEVSVGSPFRGRELSSGEGDSTTAGMTVLRADTPTGPFNDITSSLVLPDGNAVALLSSVNVGATLYVGGPFPFNGLKTLTTVAMDLGAGSVVFEVSDGGGGYTPVLIMVADSSSPYSQKSEQIFQAVTSEQVRFGDGLITFAPQLLNGLTNYWWRMRVTGNITTVPLADQIKIGPNRTEIDEDGFVERYGAARREIEIPIQIEDLSGVSPSNATIAFASGIAITPVDNNFVSSAIDGIGAVAPIPPGLDTSLQLSFRFSFLPSSNTAGDVIFQFNFATRSLNDLLSGATPSTQIDIVFSIGAGLQDQLQELIVPFTIPEAVPGDRIGIALRRIGTDILDTYPGNVERVDVQLIGFSWQ